MAIEITANHTIEEVFKLAPDSVVILENCDLKVTGCNARTERTLQELFDHHSLDLAQSQKVLSHLNKLRQVEGELQTPKASDFQIQEIEVEGRKHYYIGGLTITEAAFNNLHQVKSARGLRINLQTGGCSGFKYHYDFYDQPQNGDKEYKLSDELSIFMDDNTFARSHGSVVEFKLGLHQSGLTISNPNRKRACSCGKSMSF